MKKMHRFIDDTDVIEYSTGARKRDIELRKEEDIEYRDGILQRSSGDTLFKVDNKKGVALENGQNKKFSDAFSVHGSYKLDLQQCFSSTKLKAAKHKRNLDDQMNQNEIAEEKLTSNFNISMFF